MVDLFIYFERSLIVNNVIIIDYFDNMNTNSVVLLVYRFNLVLL